MARWVRDAQKGWSFFSQYARVRNQRQVSHCTLGGSSAVYLIGGEEIQWIIAEVKLKNCFSPFVLLQDRVVKLVIFNLLYHLFWTRDIFHFSVIISSFKFVWVITVKKKSWSQNMWYHVINIALQIIIILHYPVNNKYVFFFKSILYV